MEPSHEGGGVNDQTTLILAGVAFVILILLGTVAALVTKRVRQANAGGSPGGGMPPPNPLHRQGFIGGLFDFSFTTFVTTRIIKVLYGLYFVMVVFGLFAGIVAGLIAVSAALNTSGSEATYGLAMGAVGIAFAVLGAVVALIYGRIVFECIAVFFRIAEHLSEINRKTKHRHRPAKKERSAAIAADPNAQEGER